MSLFNEFESVSYNQWLEKITNDLKGKDFNENLVWKTDEGFDINPIYHSEQLKDNKSSKYHLFNDSTNWEIREQVVINSPKEANKIALIALKGGANSIQFNGNINTLDDLEQLLDGIMLSIISIHFYSNTPNKTTSLLSEYFSKHGINKNELNCFVSFDVIGDGLVNGKLDTIEVSEIISVNGYHYTNAGANISQELAFTLNQAVAYIDAALKNGTSIEKTIDSFHFNLGLGTNFFFEIAKIRAFKILWKLISAQYGYETLPYIHANTSSYQLAAEDSETNILRTTTEAMGAIIGGVNSLSITPFNVAYENPNNFTSRVARNIHLLLQEEAYLNKVSDAAKGAYYIENLTDKFVESALAKFKEIEAKGGFIENIQNNVIQIEIENNHKKNINAYLNNEKTLLGVNKHPNKSEKSKTYIGIESQVSIEQFKVLNPKYLAQEISSTLVNEQ